MLSDNTKKSLDPKLKKRIRRAMLRERLAEMPGFRKAVLADLRVLASSRDERIDNETFTASVIWKTIVYCWETDAFLALVLYRLRVSMMRRRIPFLPRLMDKLSMMVAQVCIGDPVIIYPGLRLPHGQVVIDGATIIQSKVRIRPFVTIGLREGNYQGPTIERGASIGTGARVIGPVALGRNCSVGANAVVVKNVPANTTVVGIPARPLEKGKQSENLEQQNDID